VNSLHEIVRPFKIVCHILINPLFLYSFKTLEISHIISIRIRLKAAQCK
jgi:hypothetical protein